MKAELPVNISNGQGLSDISQHVAVGHRAGVTLFEERPGHPILVEFFKRGLMDVEERRHLQV